MTNPHDLKPATEADTLQALAFALRHKGRKPFRNADTLMAQITAEHLLEHLRAQGFVVMRKPPGATHSTPSAAHENAEPPARSTS